ncbi:MAG: DnaA regulatory inactivator Hda [Pseudomonadales bacterium]|nr:DnaA regulatory inactivator Hda [Pseudomonadales bacterium]
MTSSKQLPLDLFIRDEYKLDNFHVSVKNAELLATLKRGRGVDPGFYFIWGEEGAGKSHLLQALCQQSELQALRQQSESAVYVPLAQLKTHSPEVLESLETLALVCLDDVDAVLGLEEWEGRLFQFFNRMRETGNRLLVSARVAPRGLQSGLADLLSRLSWGVVYQLHALDEPEKCQVLQARALSRGIVLDQDLLNYILLRGSRSTTGLFQILDRLDQLSLMEKRKITIPFIKNIMQW